MLGFKLFGALTAGLEMLLSQKQVLQPNTCLPAEAVQCLYVPFTGLSCETASLKSAFLQPQVSSWTMHMWAGRAVIWMGNKGFSYGDLTCSSAQTLCGIIGMNYTS